MRVVREFVGFDQVGEYFVRQRTEFQFEEQKVARDLEAFHIHFLQKGAILWFERVSGVHECRIDLWLGVFFNEAFVRANHILEFSWLLREAGEFSFVGFLEAFGLCFAGGERRLNLWISNRRK